MISLRARVGPPRRGNLSVVSMQHRYCLSVMNKNSPDPTANTPQPHTYCRLLRYLLHRPNRQPDAIGTPRPRVIAGATKLVHSHAPKIAIRKLAEAITFAPPSDDHLTAKYTSWIVQYSVVGENGASIH